MAAIQCTDRKGDKQSGGQKTNSLFVTDVKAEKAEVQGICQLDEQDACVVAQKFCNQNKNGVKTEIGRPAGLRHMQIDQIGVNVIQTDIEELRIWKLVLSMVSRKIFVDFMAVT